MNSSLSYQKMTAFYDNWERLVNATLLREKLRQLSRLDSISISSSEFSWSYGKSDPQEINWPNLGIPFSYKQIEEATNHFSNVNLIKRGHSGDLFTGHFPQISTSHFVKTIFFPQVSTSTSSTLVVKRIRFDQASNYWKNLTSELKFFSRIDNCRSRFVPLVGHCLESEDEKFLIYEYLEKKDLTNAFFIKTTFDNLESTDWITRLKIAIGVAESLTFMHHDFYPPLAHGDVQASSILLDHDFEVRLGNLNNASAKDSESGGLNLKATCADDVYCFGRVLLALVTGNLGIGSSADATTKKWLEGTLANFDDVMEIVDPSLIADEDLLMEVWSMAIVAKSCLNPDPSTRPLMRDVLNALEDPLRVIREGHTYTTSHQAMEELLDSWRHNPVSLQSYFEQLICGLVKPGEEV